MKPRVIFVPADKNNEEHFIKFQNSLRKFHTEEELPLIRYELLDNNDPLKWYKAKPLIASKLFEEYEIVIGADADQIILGDISDIWKSEADVSVVLNDPNFPINVWDIGYPSGTPYYNNGLVVMKSRKFVNHWLRLCNSPHFDKYQFREQDILNILTSDYCEYSVDCLDLGDKVYGELAKGLWNQARLEDDKVMINDKQLMVIHFGGGNDPKKGNYRIRFQPEVVKYIDKLIK